MFICLNSRIGIAMHESLKYMAWLCCLGKLNAIWLIDAKTLSLSLLEQGGYVIHVYDSRLKPWFIEESCVIC